MSLQLVFMCKGGPPRIFLSTLFKQFGGGSSIALFCFLDIYVTQWLYKLRNCIGVYGMHRRGQILPTKFGPLFCSHLFSFALSTICTRAKARYANQLKRKRILLHVMGSWISKDSSSTRLCKCHHQRKTCNAFEIFAYICSTTPPLQIQPPMVVALHCKWTQLSMPA